MRIYNCPKCNHLEVYNTSNEENDERRFIAACHALGAIANRAYTESDLAVATEIDMARFSVQLADALIAELEKK